MSCFCLRKVIIDKDIEIFLKLLFKINNTFLYYNNTITIIIQKYIFTKKNIYY